MKLCKAKLPLLPDGLTVDFPQLRLRVVGFTVPEDYFLLLRCREILENSKYRRVKTAVKIDELRFTVNVVNKLFEGKLLLQGL